jgi:hypothetical protein
MPSAWLKTELYDVYSKPDVHEVQLLHHHQLKRMVLTGLILDMMTEGSCKTSKVITSVPVFSKNK